jgi:hypothetical protein
MAIALVANGSAISADTNTAVTSAMNSSGANFVVGVGSALSNAQTFTDNQASSWVAGTNGSGVGNGLVISYARSITQSTAHTVTDSAGGNFPSVYAAVFSGVSTNNFDQASSGTATASTSVSPGSVTPTQNNELIITGVTTASSNAVFSIDSGFTILGQFAFVSGAAFGGAMAYKVQGVAAAVNPTWTVTSSAASDMRSQIITFIAAPAAVGTRMSLLQFGIGI